jgi:hypothetical protein
VERGLQEDIGRLPEGYSEGRFQAYHDALIEHFSEVEIAEVAAVVINMNLQTRLKLAQGETPFFEWSDRRG